MAGCCREKPAREEVTEIDAERREMGVCRAAETELNRRYQDTFEAMEGVMQKRVREHKLVAAGYTSNLDLLCEFRTERLNGLLEEYLPGADIMAMKAAGRIETMKDLLETLVYYCVRGIGGEAGVGDTSVVEDNFSFTYGVGGTAAQAAMALSAVGCPSVVHLTDDSEDVCRMMDTPYIYTVSSKRELVHTKGISGTSGSEIHFIFQFVKGERICLGGREARIPCSNRLILTKAVVNKELPFSRDYFTWIEENAKMVGSNVISGFNVLSDKGLLEKKTEEVKLHIERYHKNNPQGIAFYEDSFYHDEALGKYFRQLFYPYVDIVSMNEEELFYMLGETEGSDMDVQDIFSCIEGLKHIREKFRIRKGMIVHTKDYSMYVGDALEAEIERGLMYGNLLAAAKAVYGRYGTMKEIGEVMKLELSPRGIAYYQAAAQSRYACETVLVPAKYMDAPRYAIGLGDSFAGGVQAGF